MKKLITLGCAGILLISGYSQLLRAQTNTLLPEKSPPSPAVETKNAPPKYEELAKPPVPGGPKSPSSPQANAPTVNDDSISMNIIDTDIRKVIEIISKATGKNFLIDDKIKGKVTILSEKRMSTEEAYQAFLSALEVNGFTVVSGPGNLVKIVPLKDALTNPLPIYKDDSPYTDSFITRLITLKNVSSLDISSAIKPLISKEGNLFAYPATNTLIITDTGANIDRIIKIIKEMDTQGPEQVLEMIPIQNASAKDLADKIQKVYIDQQGGAGAPKRTAGTKGAELDEIPYISKVIADDRTNSIIVLAAKRALGKVRDLVTRLDKPLEGPQGKVHVHYLKHAEAAKVAQVLSALTSGTKTGSTPGTTGSTSAAPGAKATATGVNYTAEFEGGVKVTADESTNSLIITSTQKDYETLASEVIDKLDIPRRQVYVEVVIMELNISKDRDVGVNGQLGTTFGLGGNQTIGFGSTLGGTSAGLGSALSAAGAAGVLGKNTIDVPITNADGTITNRQIPAFGAILHAIQTDANANILSTPNLLTLDNEEAQIVVGSEVPFPTGSTVTSGGNTSYNVTRQNVGIILKITPQVNEGDMVKMKISQKVTSVLPATEAILTTVGPSTTNRTVDTVVVAKDQQTVVIGGLIDDTLEVSETKIPFLGDIPLLGNLFKSKKRTKKKTNILVFLRPYIIRDTADFLKILEKKVEERNMFIETNYGRSQQKLIRESIRTHAAELLEFKKDIQLKNYHIEKAGTSSQSRLDQIDLPPEPKAVSAPPASEKTEGKSSDKKGKASI